MMAADDSKQKDPETIALTTKLIPPSTVLNISKLEAPVIISHSPDSEALILEKHSPKSVETVGQTYFQKFVPLSKNSKKEFENTEELLGNLKFHKVLNGKW